MNDSHATLLRTVTELGEARLRRPSVSIVTPAYNESHNLPVLHKRLGAVLGNTDVDWEWVVVDDHSTDETFAVLTRLAEEDGRLRGFRFSRNFGSHTAIACGLHHAAGDCAIVMAADLQDPPEKIPDLLSQWREGAQVVWAVREHREGTSYLYGGLSSLYHALMARLDSFRDIRSVGADFFLVDRRVIDAFNQFRESHVSILALITWMGFQQASIKYDKVARVRGSSGWTLEKKLKLVVDSITSFTYFPIRMMSYAGFVIAVLGILYTVSVVADYLRGTTAPGWASLMVVVLILGGVQMLMLGVLGEYLWRALDEGRQRPRYIIESTLGERSTPR